MLPESFDHPPGRPHRRLRAGFNLIEISLGILLAVLLLRVVMGFFIAGRKGAHVVTTSLEVNEANLKSFRRLAADLRGARDALVPGLAAVDAEMPEFEWTGPDTGVHRLELAVHALEVRNGGLVPLTSRVVWYLDDPVEEEDGGRSFTLFRRTGALGAGSLGGGEGEASRVAAGIRELVFFRRARDPEAPDTRSGTRNVRIRMRTARARAGRGSGGKGYEAVLETTIHLRGGP